MVHTIQAAYGWSDPEVLDIRIGRLVQMVDVLNVADDVRKLEIEWQTKVVASTVASTIEDKKAREKIMESLEQANLRGADEGGSPQLAGADTSGDGRSLEDIVENGSVHQALAKNMRRKGPGVFGMN